MLYFKNSMLITHLDCLNLAHWLHNTAAEDGLGPISFAMVDNQGDLIWFERMDKAPARSAAIAIAKAYTSLRMGTSTAEFNERLVREKLSSRDFMDHKLTAMPGGSPLFVADGTVVGAIGISGRDVESDQVLADTAAFYFSSL